MANDHKINGYTKRQSNFIDAYVLNGGRSTLAAIEAGYSESAARIRASELLRRKDIQRVIRDKSIQLCASKVPLALQTIEHLMVNSTSDSVRLAAATDLLNRAGIKPQQEIQQIQRLNTKEQYDLILDEIYKALRDREKTINTDTLAIESMQAIENIN